MKTDKSFSRELPIDPDEAMTQEMFPNFVYKIQRDWSPMPSLSM